MPTVGAPVIKDDGTVCISSTGHPVVADAAGQAPCVCVGGGTGISCCSTVFGGGVGFVTPVAPASVTIELEAELTVTRSGGGLPALNGHWVTPPTQVVATPTQGCQYRATFSDFVPGAAMGHQFEVIFILHTAGSFNITNPATGVPFASPVLQGAILPLGTQTSPARQAVAGIRPNDGAKCGGYSQYAFPAVQLANSMTIAPSNTVSGKPVGFTATGYAQWINPPNGNVTWDITVHNLRFDVVAPTLGLCGTECVDCDDGGLF